LTKELFLLLILVIGIVIYLFFRYKNPILQAPRLFVQIDFVTDNIEWLIWHLGNSCHDFHITLLTPKNLPNNNIIQSISRRFQLDLWHEMPQDAQYIVFIDRNTTVQNLNTQVEFILDKKKAKGKTSLTSE
jgi:hypothetical protein